MGQKEKCTERWSGEPEEREIHCEAKTEEGKTDRQTDSAGERQIGE